MFDRDVTFNRRKNPAGTPPPNCSLRAAPHLGWLSLRNALSAQDDRAIPEGREKAEDQTKERYAEAMELDLPEGARAVIQRQCQNAVAIHDRIESCVIDPSLASGGRSPSWA
jgi:uncharacterized protein (TIGR02284 family)